MRTRRVDRTDGMTITEDQAIANAGRALAISDAAVAQMTPREQAEAAWTPTSNLTVDELEQQIRMWRGMSPLADTG